MTEDAARTIGQAGRAAGVTRKAIRVYEQRGLLPPATRTVSGYRLFSDEAVDTLRFIRRARTLGLGLDDIARILAEHRHGGSPCSSVYPSRSAHRPDRPGDRRAQQAACGPGRGGGELPARGRRHHLPDHRRVARRGPERGERRRRLDRARDGQEAERTPAEVMAELAGRHAATGAHPQGPRLARELRDEEVLARRTAAPGLDHRPRSRGRECWLGADHRTRGAQARRSRPPRAPRHHRGGDARRPGRDAWSAPQDQVGRGTPSVRLRGVTG